MKLKHWRGVTDTFASNAAPNGVLRFNITTFVCVASNENDVIPASQRDFRWSKTGIQFCIEEYAIRNWAPHLQRESLEID